ncbi:glycoside hydrolase family 113 [Clostridium oryzae]|uniref:Hydrolase n=1 Tax=Clostridium oryzae TaxID=1450648 RepID=A0A1V4IEJ8_9CLOT|nr:hydrolase [Clostridium oryzae]OPJ58274.1 hypothetical protein CLORY_36940 [Clostridium oryzae]
MRSCIIIKLSKKNIIILTCVLFLFTACSNYKVNKLSSNIKNIKLDSRLLQRDFSSKIKCGNLSVDYNNAEAVNDIARLKLNTVNVPVRVDIANINSADMRLNNESLKKAENIIKKLTSNNINVILEPYPWIENGTAYETKYNPKSVDKFFNNWKNVVIREIIKKIAVPYKVNAICIASNFDKLEKYESKWLEVYSYARQNYNGLITYKTNWWYTAQWDSNSKWNFKRKLNNKIFAKVDFISIAAYFELSGKKTNSVNELKKDLYASSIYNRKQNIVNEVKQLHNVYNKPIFFGELGFPRRDYAAKEPWNAEVSAIENGNEQARCFRAYTETFSQKWFMGFSVFAIGNKAKDKIYYPSKETADVISKLNSQ